ncbi:hypothetical protein [Nocardioides gilvus]|uniref:hypothetical protein n=1 Tax=Nocardioides gilvus TaxID=1735589 RepID=UPI000D74D46A|nr:hypothetical protein [Nocardioides gilvus]
MPVDDTRALLVPNAMVLGAGVGLAVGAALGGSAFLAPGLVVGASVGLVLGAAAAARRSHTPR